MSEYYKQPKTAVIEGLSSALCDIAMARDEAGLPEMNLTDDERKRIENEVTEYILSRFTVAFKEVGKQ